MDETTKVIIATLSGFIIAFFAEPVKNYFANKSQLRNLRIALYTELISNYFALVHFTMDGTSNDSYMLYQVSKYELRIERYKHALQDELFLFYQLKEANLLNVAYGRINQLMHLNEDLIAVYGKRGLKSASAIFTQHGGTFKYMFTTSFYSRGFNAKILRKLVRPEQYKEIMEKGRKAIAKDSEQSSNDQMDVMR